MRAGAEAGGLWAWWSQASWALSGALGTISALKLAWGASTPWKRIRCSLGRGTSAAQALHELQRRHHDRGGAVVPGALELQHDLARAIALEPLVGNRRAGDIAAQAFELLALHQRHSVLPHAG